MFKASSVNLGTSMNIQSSLLIPKEDHMNRNAFWKMILFIILAFIPSELVAKDQKRPNILLIVADDLG